MSIATRGRARSPRDGARRRRRCAVHGPMACPYTACPYTACPYTSPTSPVHPSPGIARVCARVCARARVCVPLDDIADNTCVSRSRLVGKHTAACVGYIHATPRHAAIATIAIATGSSTVRGGPRGRGRIMRARAHACMRVVRRRRRRRRRRRPRAEGTGGIFFSVHRSVGVDDDARRRRRRWAVRARPIARASTGDDDG